MSVPFIAAEHSDGEMPRHIGAEDVRNSYLSSEEQSNTLRCLLNTMFQDLFR
jgi:hypothetical protein